MASRRRGDPATGGGRGAGQRLLVDGYNVVHGWPELRRLLDRVGAEEARRHLIGLLGEYVALTGAEVTVVFDGPPTTGPAQLVDGVTVLFSGAAGSADHLIERLVNRAAQKGQALRLAVVTDDRGQRDMVRGMGGTTMGVEQLHRQVAGVREEASDRAQRSREVGSFGRRLEHRLPADVVARLERLRRGGVDADAEAASSPE